MTEWTRIGRDEDVVDGEPFAAALDDGTAVALYRFEGAVYAIGDICPHEDVRLSEGFLDGGTIECPLHQSCFEIRTGKVIEGGPAYEDVPSFDVRNEDGALFVRAKR
ncbi:Rieske (2Fe-2S) protein [Sphingomonas profundi]|uniref:Rieske (2Fe-2S) protein n=1 Tax=Alterirhizorhabdus profundi TaxID=2681549 RepID=UPI0012E9906F|nr:non-heme iron oxygenase ferredoxin subunit [Sphingomonas profundi]